MRTLGNFIVGMTTWYSFITRDVRIGVCVCVRGWDSGGAKESFTKHGQTPCV